MPKITKSDYIPKVGDVVEVWGRETPRHKYRMEMSFVQVLRIIKEEDEDGQQYHDVSVKVSKSYCSTNGGNGYSSCTSFQTRGDGKWDRCFVKIGHLPVKKDNFEFKKIKK